MPDANPPAPQLPQPHTPITMLEVEEYLFAETAARFARTNSPDAARDHIRESFRMHRFFVITWLMQNGVAIPVHLAADATHPPVGNQRPDQPI